LQFKRTANDGATFGIDTLVDFPGNDQKIVVPLTSPGIAQRQATPTTRTTAASVGSGRHNLMLKRDCWDTYNVKAGVPANVAHDIFPQTPGDLVPCEKCRGGIWLLIDVRLTATPSPGHDLKYQPGCTYMYEATWLCPTTGDIQHGLTTKHVSEECVVHG
jgi:hypothetical protein